VIRSITFRPFPPEPQRQDIALDLPIEDDDIIVIDSQVPRGAPGAPPMKAARWFTP